MVNLFTDPTERAKAMGVFGFVAAGGGSVGVVLGGFLTELNWHWIFLVNVPIGARRGRCSRGACCPAAPRTPAGQARRRRRGHRDRGADARRLRDRQRQPGRLDVGADARLPGGRGRAGSASFLVIESTRARR